MTEESKGMIPSFIPYYKLADDGETPVPCYDIMEMEGYLGCSDPARSKRNVGKTEVGPYLVSTVFLCIDHG